MIYIPRIPFFKEHKSPFHTGNINTIKSVLTDTTNYLKTLKFNGISLIFIGRKMFLMQFIVIMTSTLDTVYKLLGMFQIPPKYKYSYLPNVTYDHVVFKMYKQKNVCF